MLKNKAGLVDTNEDAEILILEQVLNAERQLEENESFQNEILKTSTHLKELLQKSSLNDFKHGIHERIKFLEEETLERARNNERHISTTRDSINRYKESYNVIEEQLRKSLKKNISQSLSSISFNKQQNWLNWQNSKKTLENEICTKKKEDQATQAYDSDTSQKIIHLQNQIDELNSLLASTNSTVELLKQQIKDREPKELVLNHDYFSLNSTMENAQNKVS